MNKSRGNSASRLGSAMEGDIRMLRNTITSLEQELIQSRNNTQKVSEQLNCLMLLVKRAWTGDKNAAVNVANIVGVAPPDFEETYNGLSTILAAKPKFEEENFEPPKVFMRNKSRALNNWAVLTIGLLNREYSHLEQQQEAKARQYLQQRQSYLEEQLVYHRDNQFRDTMAFQDREAEYVTNLQTRVQEQQQQRISPPHQPLRRVNSLTDLGRNKMRSGSFTEDIVGNKAFITQPGQNQSVPANSRPTSSKTRTPARHLYRPATQKQEPLDLTWADLVIEAKPQSDVQDDYSSSNVEYVVHSNNGHREVRRQKNRQRRISYDDPARYNVGGLYDAENALGPGNNVFRKRPPSAKIQRQSDSMRARPKSAVYAKSERPLKYETTRPVSAIVTSKTKDSSKRPPSGKKAPPTNTQAAKTHSHNGQFEQQNQHEDSHTDYRNDISYDSDEDVDDIVYDEKAFSRLGIDLKEVEREVRQAQGIKVNITKPKCVIEFEDDVRRMHDMEKTVRRTAMELQKKLGINEEGIVY